MINMDDSEPLADIPGFPVGISVPAAPLMQALHQRQTIQEFTFQATGPESLGWVEPGPTVVAPMVQRRWIRHADLEMTSGSNLVMPEADGWVEATNETWKAMAETRQARNASLRAAQDARSDALTPIDRLAAVLGIEPAKLIAELKEALGV